MATATGDDPLLLGDPAKIREAADSLSREDLEFLRAAIRWKAIGRKKQIPPNNSEWNFYGVKSGRGFGKTLSAAQWIWQRAARDPGSYNFVISPTHEDLLGVCFYGPTGFHGSYEDKSGAAGPKGALYPVIPKSLIKIATKSPPYICLWNDAIIRGYAADTPERLRGPQCHRAWCDEIAAWRYPEKTWDNLIMGLRLGLHPQVFWTGTPKPKPFIRNLVKLPKSIVVDGSTYENRENLTEIFYDNVAKYEGTAIGRQELWGEILDPEEGGFVKRSQWRLWSARKALPHFRFIVISLDTAFTERTWDKKEQSSDYTACTVWGLFEYERKDHIMLLDAWQDRLGFPQLVRAVKLQKTYTYGDRDEPILKPQVPDRMRPRHQGRPADIILIEEKGSGISLRQQLAVENILTESYNPGRLDKLSRLHAVSPCFPAGRVWAIESERQERAGQPKSWAEAVISQFCSYVGEGSLEHDDLLDTGTQALRFLMDRFNFKFTVRPDPQEVVEAAARRLQSRNRRNPYDG